MIPFGFVSKLPHSLIRAFKATLEEVVYADLLLHIVDASYADHDFHIGVTNQVLKDMGAGDKEKIIVYNKIDIAGELISLPGNGEEILYVSAKRGDHMDQLIQTVREKLFSDLVIASLLIPYDRGDLSSYLCENTKVIQMEYQGQGTYFEAEISKRDYGRLQEFLVGQEDRLNGALQDGAEGR